MVSSMKNHHYVTLPFKSQIKHPLHDKEESVSLDNYTQKKS